MAAFTLVNEGFIEVVTSDPLSMQLTDAGKNLQWEHELYVTARPASGFSDTLCQRKSAATF